MYISVSIYITLYMYISHFMHSFFNGHWAVFSGNPRSLLWLPDYAGPEAVYLTLGQHCWLGSLPSVAVGWALAAWILWSHLLVGQVWRLDWASDGDFALLPCLWVSRAGSTVCGLLAGDLNQAQLLTEIPGQASQWQGSLLSCCCECVCRTGYTAVQILRLGIQPWQG